MSFRASCFAPFLKIRVLPLPSDCGELTQLTLGVIHPLLPPRHTNAPSLGLRGLGVEGVEG